MNLYRSFGNLMEAWITEEGQCSYSEGQENNDEDSSSLSSPMGTNPRSESVDSGVETASSDMSFPATSCSISTDNTEIETFTSEGEVSTSQSPVLSSPLPSSSSPSSPRLCSTRAQEGSIALHQRVEEALQRTHSKLIKDNTLPLTVDDVLRRQPRASFLPKRHASELVRGQRSESFGLRRTVNPLVPMGLTRRRPMSMISYKQPAQTRLEDLSETEEKGLSPGLSYLEEVCQMLEEIARKQMHNQALQMGMNVLQEYQDMEALDTCQSGFQSADEDLSSCRRPENKTRAECSSSEPQRRKDYRRHFRQRSASDTTIAALHLRKLKADCRGQHLSTDDLLEKTEEDHKKQESKEEERSKINMNWKFKMMSLGRETSLRDRKSQQMQSAEKNSARRRFIQLFRRKTLLV
uniref:uncharacterized protein si:dkey-106l3.7 n=1 Tax=Scatophagus argus TaxID=75038 RepID=UPI001ED7F099|nr:uncharacterized protein si:dkey-106l3.7 [Scatophagus argus]